MKKTLIVLALCLCALPALQARSLSEDELLESTALLLQSNSGLTEENMMLGAGVYGNSNPTGSYGGLFDDVTDNLNTDLFESGSAQQSSTMSTPAATATASVQAKPATSAAVPADKSMAVFIAGAMVAVSAFLL